MPARSPFTDYRIHTDGLLYMNDAPSICPSDPREAPGPRASDVAGVDTPADGRSEGPLDARARSAMDAAAAQLSERQYADGHWRGELEGDSILQSEYILFKWILGHEANPRLPAIASYLRRQQQPDGTWVQYPGGGMDISATAKGYFALKLMGDDPEAEHMRQARDQVRAHGGAERVNSFTKFYFACLGQVPYSAMPSIPPELVFFPKWSYIHLDKVSAWTRTMILPLSLITVFQPVRELSAKHHVDELFMDEGRRRRLVSGQDRPHPVWSRFFLAVDKGLKGVDAVGMTPWRKRAIAWIEKWLVEHLEHTAGLGAIYPPMVYIQIALRCLGYDDDHPLLVKAREDLDELMIRDPQTEEIRIQPCFSPVWDTGIAAYAMTYAGFDGGDERMDRCARWLIDNECELRGDWSANVEGQVKPSGWYFEYRNEWYPDVDDTAMVAMALQRIATPEAKAAAGRGVSWILAMQNEDGGWAAFDRTVERPILEHVPFADHNAIQDPSCPDITGRVLECLGHHGFTKDAPAVAQAIEFMRSRQEPDGCWFGRWGVNYIYGTWQVLGGLKMVGYNMNAPWVQAAGHWLRAHQQEDGSFGESADSYENPARRGQGPATPSQTAWGVMALMFVHGADDPDVERGIEWLCQTQLDYGDWEETWFTGTGFPRVFYLRYHLYRLYFPLMALGRFVNA